MCPFIVASDIFTLKDIAKQHYNNIKLNVPDNASLSVYQATLGGHWLVMGLKTNNSLVDVQLSKMEVAIKNIASLMAVGNLTVNHLMERVYPGAMLFKFAMSEDHQVAL
ncbi:unnamed protein product [Sphagnum tenellum]